VASIIAGLILTFVSRDAAGSGIPQAKVTFLERFWIYAGQGGDHEILCRRYLDWGRLQSWAGRSDGSYCRRPRLEHCRLAWGCQTGAAPGTPARGRCRIGRGIHTPLSAITFVLEEIIEDLNNRGYLAQLLIASVTATFVCHIFLGVGPRVCDPANRGAGPWDNQHMEPPRTRERCSREASATQNRPVSPAAK
jgi:hypothetical protein